MIATCSLREPQFSLCHLAFR